MRVPIFIPSQLPSERGFLQTCKAGYSDELSTDRSAWSVDYKFILEVCRRWIEEQFLDAVGIEVTMHLKIAFHSNFDISVSVSWNVQHGCIIAYAVNRFKVVNIAAVSYGGWRHNTSTVGLGDLMVRLHLIYLLMWSSPAFKLSKTSARIVNMLFV